MRGILQVVVSMFDRCARGVCKSRGLCYLCQQILGNVMMQRQKIVVRSCLTNTLFLPQMDI